MNRARNPRQVYLGVVIVFLVVFAGRLNSQGKADTKWMAPGGLELHYVKAEPTNYLGRQAVRITDVAPASVDDGKRFAVIPGSSFRDGTIEIYMTGDTLATADPTARGFVGLAFRVSADRSHYECFYLRPTNGRADDQLRRNHSLQYISMPDFGWQKLRTDAPGVYESYADLVPAQWTQVKIHVEGNHAQLYVNGAPQPALIVNDLRLPPAAGAIALWVGPGTVANFSGLKIE
jgi:hypothetical protein